MQGSPPHPSWISRHRLLAFLCLAYLLSFYPWIIAMLRARTSGPNPFGPFVAGIVVAALTGGKSELKTLFARLVRARVGWQYYAFIFGLPIVICLAAVAIVLPLFGLRPVLPAPDKFRELPERFILFFYSSVWAKNRAGADSPCRNCKRNTRL